MEVLFFGNHTVGLTVLQHLVKLANVIGVVAHPDDPEDGKRYASVYNWTIENKIPSVRGRPKDPEVRDFVHSKSPDMIWITDYRYLLPQDFLSIPRLGTINIHPSLLPAYRGRAPINWAIINAEERIGITVHFVDSGTDSGDIISQESFLLSENEDVADALNKLYPLYASLTEKTINYFMSGNIPRQKQDENQATYFPARRPEDGIVNWHHPARKIFNFIRAITSPYPGAFSFTSGYEKILIWKAITHEFPDIQGEIGEIVSIDEGCPVIQCGQGFLKITSYEHEKIKNFKLCIGDRFLASEEYATVFVYNKNLSKHGESHSALNWGSKESQQIRFKVLAEIGDLNGAKILDVGCGLAHFADWLDEQGICVDYTGLDITASLLTKARERRPDLRLVHGSVLDSKLFSDIKFDFIFSSGIFYTYTENSEHFLETAVRNMWEKAVKGIAFNSLSSWASDIEPDEYYADPLTISNFCRTLSPWIVMRHDYHPRDFTIFLTRKRRCS